MRNRDGGRSANIKRRKQHLIEQMPWCLPKIIDSPTEPLDQSGVEAIHIGAMRILADIGIEFLNSQALEIFRKAGCIIKDQNVRMDEDLVMEMISRAPKTWTITPRNETRQLEVGDNIMLFGNVSSPPNYWDYELGYWWFSDVSRFGKVLSHVELYKRIIDLPGTIAEFGVYKANSLIRWLSLREILETSSTRKIIGFDAFGSFACSCPSLFDCWFDNSNFFNNISTACTPPSII